jgi:hypothetical protein
MIEVIATMCLLTASVDVEPRDLLKDVLTRDKCQEISRTFDEDERAITPHACMQNSAKFAIEWLKTHPGYGVRLLGCRPYRTEA